MEERMGMANTTPQLMQELTLILQELPTDKARELVDFAHFLQARHGLRAPRGSAAAILYGLQAYGPLQFEAGELDGLLAELEALRALDMNDDDRLLA